MNRSTLRLAIIVLTLATALIHFSLVPSTMAQMGLGGALPFILNGLGYLTLLVVYCKWVPVPVIKISDAVLTYIFMGFAAVTIVAYFAVNGAASLSIPLGLADKVIEVLLIAALWLHSRAA